MNDNRAKIIAAIIGAIALIIAALVPNWFKTRMKI